MVRKDCRTSNSAPPKMNLGSLSLILSRSFPHPLQISLFFLSTFLPPLSLCSNRTSFHHGNRKTQLHPQPPHPQQERIICNVRYFPRHEFGSVYLLLLVNRTQKNADDVVITLAIRTPLTKGFKGGMKDTPLDFLVYQLLKKVIEKSNIDPQIVEDVCLGNVSISCDKLHYSY